MDFGGVAFSVECVIGEKKKKKTKESIDVFWFNLNLYRRMGDSRFGGFWGCYIFSGICHRRKKKKKSQSMWYRTRCVVFLVLCQ